MAKPKEAESFEVSGVPYKQSEDPLALVHQASRAFVTTNPACTFTIRVGGDKVVVKCHYYGQSLDDHTRRQQCLQAMSTGVDAYVKFLKKQYRELGGGDLKMVEDKDGRGYDLERVSLNDRYMLVYHRIYHVDDLVRVPDEG